MNRPTIPYPPEVLWALQQELKELEEEGPSPFGEAPDELEQDLANARQASHRQEAPDFDRPAEHVLRKNQEIYKRLS